MHRFEQLGCHRSAMKKLTAATIAFFFISRIIHAQDMELNLNAGSGFFKYTGNVGRDSPLLFSESAFPANTPGHRPGFSYMFTLEAKRITVSGLIYGLETGYQLLQSKTDQQDVSTISSSSFFLPAKGRSTTTTSYVCINPFFGYRLNSNKWHFDFQGGVDYGISIKKTDKIEGTYTTSGERFSKRTRLENRPDFRTKIKIAAVYNRTGIFAGYAYGFTNYFDDNAYYQDSKAHSNFLSAGISFKLL